MCCPKFIQGVLHDETHMLWKDGMGGGQVERRGYVHSFQQDGSSCGVIVVKVSRKQWFFVFS